MRRSSLVLAMLVAACDQSLQLPAPPGEEGPPVISSFAPAQAFAGWPVRIEGAGFGSRAEDVQVRFGASAPVAARAADGTSIEAVVPADATTGTILVTTPRGSVRSEATFTFEGRGELARGRVLQEADLRPYLEDAVETPDGIAVLERSRYERAAHLAFGVHPFSPEDPMAFAMADRRLAIVDRATCSLQLFETALRELDETIPLGQGGECGTLLSLAISGDSYLIVSLPHLLAGSISGAEPPVPVDLGTSSSSDAVASLGDGRFLAADQEGLRTIEHDGAAWRARTIDSSHDFSDEILKLDAVPGVAAIAMTASRKLVLYDASVPDPILVREYETNWSVGAIEFALSADGRRLAVSLHQEGRIVLFELGAELVPVASYQAELPGGIHRASRGRFLVARLGGVVALSQQTGQEVESLEAPSNFAQPTLRRSPEGEGWVIDFAARGYDRVLTMKADLSEEATAPRTPSVAPPLERVFAGRERADLFVVRAGEIRHVTPDAADTEDPARRFVIGEDDVGIYDVAVAPDASAVACVLVGDDTRIVVLDTATDFTADHIAPGIPTDSEDVRLAVAGGRLLIAEEESLRILELAPARLGEEVVVGRFDSSDLTLMAVERGLALLTHQRDGEDRLAILRLSDGAVVADAPTTLIGWDDGLTISPSARFAWWLDLRATPRRVVGARIDAETGIAERSTLLVPTTRGVRWLVPLPDGERLVLLDVLRDRAYLVD